MTAVAAPPGIDEEAFGVLERVVGLDPSDDEARRRYVEGAISLGAEPRAAEALRASMRSVESGEVRERVALDVATLFLKQGELALARQAFLDVVAIGAGGPPALAAARKLIELDADADPRILGAGLEALVRMSPDPAERVAAAERIVRLRLTAPMKDARLAVAYAALVDSPRADEALDWLRAFLEKRGDDAGLSAVLRAIAERSAARAEAERPAAESEDVAEVAYIDEPIATNERTPEPPAEDQLAILETRARLLSDEAERVAVLTAAMDYALGAGLFDRAVALCRHAINADPSSPVLHARYDALVPSEPPGERLARYEAALSRALDAGRRGALRETIATLRAGEGDLRGAMAMWQELVADGSCDEAVHTRLVDAATRLDDPSAGKILDAACQALSGRARDAMSVRKALWLSSHREGEAALEICRAIVEQPLDASAFETIADIAADHDDVAVRRRALERMVATIEPAGQARALELLGNLRLEQLGDAEGAASAWKAAAAACRDDEPEHARALYERALDAQPGDGEAAERLVEFFAAADGWARLPDVLWPVARSGDPEKAAEYLLRFHEGAIDARAIDPLVAMCDEVLARISGASPWRVPLLRVRATALAADPARAPLAAEALRALIEVSGDAEAVRVLEAFIEARPSAEERHREGRWLYAWRADHTERPAAVLVAWAKAEEEHGESEEALRIYERVLEVDPDQRDALEARCRAHMRQGDTAAGLAILDRLRRLIPPAERAAVHVRFAEWLATDLGRSADAASVLAPALIGEPPVAGAQELGRRLLADPTTSGEVIERLEAAGAAEPGFSGPLWRFLLSARDETESMPEARVRWYLRVLESSPEPTDEGLAYALDGAMESPESVAMWDWAERLGRALGRPQAVADAYHRLFASSIASSAADALGRRMVAFEDDCAIVSGASIEALLSVLDLSPGARWALDRVKLALGAEARWDELFALYDKALAVTGRDEERADLLHEAASVAKDLAGEPRRATSYFELLRALRPGDVAVDAALERLYEKQGQRSELIGLLQHRAEVTTGFKLRELRRQIAVLWLELGETESASAVLDRMLADGTVIGDIGDLLEQVARPSPADSAGALSAGTRAVDRLIRHYTELDRPADLVRIAELGIDLGDATGQLCERVRAWVGFVLLASEAGARAPFADALERTAERFAGDTRLAAIAYRSLFVRAMRIMRRGETDAARTDAERGAYGAALARATLLVQAGGGAASFRLLHRASRLPFERERRRDLLCTAAFVCADDPSAWSTATSAFDELFDDDPADEIAAGAMSRFAEILEGSGQHAKLGGRWEEQARIRAREGVTEAARANWERAGRLWERLELWEKAVAAYGEGAALQSEGSFDALARIHRARGQWQEASKALEWLYAHNEGAARVARALELAEAYVETGDRDRARARLESVFPAAIETETAGPVRGRLLDLYRRDGVWRPLARLLSSEAVRVTDLAQKLALARQACEILEQQLKEPAEAAALLHQVVAWAPRDEAFRRWLVDVLESLGRWDDAASVLAGQIALFEGQRSKDRALVHHRRARALVRGGRLPEALTELRSAAEMGPAQPAILRDLGRVALDVGELDLSESTYRALLLAIPRSAGQESIDRAEAFLDLGEIALRRGDAERGDDLTDSAFDAAASGPGDALDVLERHLAARGRHRLLAREEERCADRASTLAQRARSLGRWVDVWAAQLGRPDDAAGRIRAHVERVARDVEHELLADPGAWSALATVQAAVGNDAVRESFAASLENAVGAAMEPAARSALRVSLARLLLEAPGRSDAAVAALRTALTEDPSSRDAAEWLSQALEREGRYEELVDALEGSVRSLSPEREPGKFASALWRLGRALEQSNRTEAALELYESVLDQPAADAALLGELSSRLSVLGSRRLADCLERRLALDPRAAPEIASRLIALRDARGDRAGAMRALEAAFAADPTDAAIRDRLVDQHEQAQEWERAADVLGRAVSAAPADRETLRRWIDVLGRAGAHDELRGAVDAALLRNPNDVEMLVFRASARERAGNLTGALADLEAASALDSRLQASLLDLLTRVVAAGGGAAKSAHVLRLSDLLLRFSRPKDARGHLERLNAESPGRRDVLRKIAFAASAEHDWVAVAEAHADLLRLAERDDARDEVMRVAQAMFSAYEKAGRLDDGRARLRPTIAAWKAREDVPVELERLCEMADDFDGLAHALVRRASSHGSPADKHA
ncbi:MAG: tetratricopeptide repeat protein, partial [Polyangiaceae bacterium]|nr:tetratricopeptide repeat protein [Polyangiaceae bacterium]